MSTVLPPAPRILLVMMSALGDAVHALPVVTAIKRRYPDAHLTWVLQPGPASLVLGHPDVDDVIVFQRSLGLRAFTDVRRKLRDREFDIVIDLQVYFKASVVTAMARAPIKLGFDRARARDLNWLVTNRKIPAGPPRHVQEQYFEFLEYLGIPAEPVEWKLGPWPSEREWRDEFAARYDRPIVSLVIASSAESRDWPADRWIELHDALVERYGLQPVLVGGSTSREIEMEAMLRERSRHPIESTLGCSLRDLVSVLDSSALVVAPDTGPTHMAVALGRPVITLAGPLNPKRTGPFRRFHDLIVDAYGEPGEDYPVSMEKRPDRMQRITVDDVLRKVDLWKERYAEVAG